MKRYKVDGVRRNFYCGCDGRNVWIDIYENGASCLEASRTCPKCGYYPWTFPKRWRKNKLED